ncbi:MAG: hypothetical protein CMP10_10310 [Zetaproteobacteria bacterium]|nr:hypothetical protein [Pseudobdellovibrionaceae bacterium]
MANQSIPIYVDLDGSLIKSDSLIESLVLLIKQSPVMILMIPFWLLRGKAGFKDSIANQVKLDPRTLPYNEPVLEFLKNEKKRGRHLYLATAAHESIAVGVYDHLQIFDGYLASSSQRNLSGDRKADAIEEQHRDYAYVGNASCDLPIWRRAREAIVVDSGKRLVKSARTVTEVTNHFSSTDLSPIMAALKAMRFHQWAKNALLFTAAVFAHELFAPEVFGKLILAFFSFGFLASAVYLINDILDLTADRVHPQKKFRPIASGDFPIEIASVGAVFLIVTSLCAAWLIDPGFGGMLIGYFIITLCYSLVLKKIVLIDVLTLAILYTWRILAGAVLTDITVSFWLLGFSVFIFLSLALAKRAGEILQLKQISLKTGRGYQPDDIQMIGMLGVASGFSAVVILTLYLNSPQVIAFYQQPVFLWLNIIFVLYWISRVWLKTFRGEMHHDPIVFAIKDPVSYAIGCGVLISAIAGAYLSLGIP